MTIPYRINASPGKPATNRRRKKTNIPGFIYIWGCFINLVFAGFSSSYLNRRLPANQFPWISVFVASGFINIALYLGAIGWMKGYYEALKSIKR